jgi:hypothetical protein
MTGREIKPTASSKRGSAELSQYKTERGFKKMKFNFRKIASALASTAMVGSTIALAAAATFPDPFVKNGVADVVYVYGATVDLAALPDVTAALSDAVQTDDGDVVVPSDGDFVELNKAVSKTNLGDTLTTVYSKLDDGELGTVLADGTYENDNDDEFDYTQDIQFAGETVTFFRDTSYSDDPSIGFDWARNTNILNYTLDFTDPADGDTDWSDLETTDLPFLGRDYYVLSAATTTDGPPKLTLLDSANEATLQQGESATVAGYSVTVDFISENEAIFVIDGVEIDALGAGETKKIETGAYLAVKRILYTGRESDQPRVEFSIGSGKIVIENSEEVTMNDEDVDGLTAYLTNSSAGELDQILLTWDTDDEVYFVPGSELLLPGFESISVSFVEFFTGDDDAEMMDVRNSGDSEIQLQDFEVEDGSIGEMSLLSSNGTDFTLIGDSSTDKLFTTGTSTITMSDIDDFEYFVATWISGEEAESYVLYVDSIDDSTPANNKTVIKSHGSDASWSLNIGDSEDVGNVAFTLTAAREDTGAFTATVAAAGGGSVYLDRLVTKDGLMVYLPVDTSTEIYTGEGAINLSVAAQTSFALNFTESDQDGNVGDGETFEVTLGHNAQGEVQAASVSTSTLAGTSMFETSNDNEYVGYVNSDLSTYIVNDQDPDQRTVEISYFGEETYARIFVSEAGVTTTGGSGGTIDIVQVMDSEFATHEMNTKNAIVIGGTCVNSVAAELLGVSADTCGADWTAATGLGSGQAWIGTYDHPYATGKVATLVAGWGQGDTVNAATALATQNIDISVGKGYTVGSDQVAVPVVA